MVQESGCAAARTAARVPAALPLREIPATLQDLVMSRLDRMEGEREVAQLGAVLGREFGHELLAAVAGLGEAALQAELAKLVEAEILFPKGRPPRCTYLFKHALIEDALYKPWSRASGSSSTGGSPRCWRRGSRRRSRRSRSCWRTTTPRPACPSRPSATG